MSIEACVADSVLLNISFVKKNDSFRCAHATLISCDHFAEVLILGHP